MNEDREATWGDRTAVALATVLFAALSTWAGMVSKGFLEADACLHYQYARFVWREPYRLIDVWGRPVCTGLYALPALLAGRTGVHVMSLAIALGMAWMVRRIAQLQGYRWPALAFVFVLAQPLVFLHSFSELTELPFALLVTAGFLAYRQCRWWQLALVAGVMPLARPEGFGFLILTAGALMLHSRWRWLPLLPLPLAIWSYGGWVQSGMTGHWWQWLPANWPYAAQSLYHPGSPLHFIALLPAITGPLLFPPVLLGLRQILHESIETLKEWGLFELPHPARCDLLIAAIPLLILLGHSLLYWRGKMASNGELRYLLVVAPFWALLAAKGWTWLWQRFQWRHIYRYAALASLLPLCVNLPRIGYPAIPLVVMSDWRESESIAHWYHESGIATRYPYLVVAHPGVTYAMDISPTDQDKTRPMTKKTIHEAKPGSLLIWDPIYSIYNADADRSIPVSEILAAGWVPITPPKNVSQQWSFFISPRSIDGSPSRSNGEPADLSPKPF